MGERITTMVDDELDAMIETISEYHSMPKSRTLELLVREGLQAREMRYRFEQIDIKLDILIKSLGGGPVAREKVSERLKKVDDRNLPAGNAEAGLRDSQVPFFQSSSEFPDRSDEEAEFLEQYLDKREDIEEWGEGDVWKGE